MGMLYKRGAVWWIKYYRNGRGMRESSLSTKERDARRLLKLREGDIEHGLPGWSPSVNARSSALTSSGTGSPVFTSRGIVACRGIIRGLLHFFD